MGRRPIFHPLEVALVGYHNSGKTTLAARVVPLLGLDVAYVKQAQEFDLDHPGKDTHTLTSAGAGAVFISDPNHQALVRQRPLNPLVAPLDFVEADAVLVEGHKHSPLPQIVVLDADLALIADPAFAPPQAAERPVLAAVGPWSPDAVPALPWNVPYFHRDDAPGVAAFLRGLWDEKTAQRPLKGLVLSGGRSTRMGSDKAVIDYHGVPEVTRVFDLLGEFCAEVFVSCRPDQAEEPGRRGRPQIHDVLVGKGPLGGIAAALESDPDAAWLVVACDLPRLDRGVLAALVAGRNPYKVATAFRGYQDLPEPLCAVYEPKARGRLYQFLALGFDCPRKMLIHSAVQVLDPVAGDRLANVNSPADREALVDRR